MFLFKKTAMPASGEALPGRSTPIATAGHHHVNGRALKGPYPDGLETAIFGLGCFWGAERKFWQLGDGIHVTAVGYAGGQTPNPTYEEVCSGRTGHNEVVLVVYDPNKIPYERQRSAPQQQRRKKFMTRRCGPRAMPASRPRSQMRRNSISPRTTTSNISPRILAAIAGSAAPASLAR